MNMYKKVLIVFLTFFLLFFSQINVLAAELNLPKITINPDSYLLYSFKRLVEKGVVFSKFSKESKSAYYQELTLKRLSELKYVAEKRLLGEMEHSTQRLSYQVGSLIDYIKENPDLEKNKKDIKELMLNSKNLLGNLRDLYPANSSYWLLVQHSINSIDLNLEKLK